MLIQTTSSTCLVSSYHLCRLVLVCLLLVSCRLHLTSCEYYALYDGQSDVIATPTGVIAVAVINELPSSGIDIPLVNHRVWDAASYSTSPSLLLESKTDQRLPSTSTANLKALESKGIMNAAMISSPHDLKTAAGGKKKKKKKKKSSKKKKSKKKKHHKKKKHKKSKKSKGKKSKKKKKKTSKKKKKSKKHKKSHKKKHKKKKKKKKSSKKKKKKKK